MINHTCDKCGKPLDPVNWQTARIGDRYEERAYKLCSTCAELADSTLRTMMDCDGHVKKDYPPTVDGILRDFGVDIAHALDADPDATVPEAIIAHYAAKLQLREGA